MAPNLLNEELTRRARLLYKHGKSAAHIADKFRADGYTTIKGTRIYRTAVLLALDVEDELHKHGSSHRTSQFDYDLIGR